MPVAVINLESGMASARTFEKHSAFHQRLFGTVRSAECHQRFESDRECLARQRQPLRAVYRAREWASESKAAGTLLPIPAEFETLRFDPFLRKKPIGKCGENRRRHILNEVLIIGLALGMRHAVDPDHLAAIDGLTRLRPRRT